ncbi:alpha/beta hydrolase [uncultured Draconibacterium sp.]|uniref:alpha/beta hydrolase n=1 Tax=uncultured Draconibacterium sp. TaxID=1573823 RepID=UPI003260C626
MNELPEAINCKGAPASFANERYGPHERNTFDIWLADAVEPTPLVIYIHGGGFVGGDKSRYYDSEDWGRLLDAGISVASINYRFMNEPPYGILGSMNDSKRCLQYIKRQAKRYNIDKKRIACCGGSAGAGTSLWLAFSADMADAENDDPVLRESTRIACAAAFSTQSTYDILQWPGLLHFPPYEGEEQLLSIARVFGFKSAEGIDVYAQKQIRSELDFLAKMSSDAPPFFVFNHYEGGIPANEDELHHHPLHAKALKDRADDVGAEAFVYAPALGIANPSGKDVVEFFIEKLRPKPAEIIR